MSDSLGDIFTRLLKNLPNHVDGDGRAFVAALKKILSQYSTTTENIVTWKERISDITLTEIDIDSTHANLQVSFSTSGITNYASAQIWVKVGTGTYAQVGTTTGNSYIINGVTNGATYHVKVLAVNTSGDVSPLESATEASMTIAIESIVPGTPKQFILTWDEHGAARWEWVYEGDKYTDFFELRMDNNPGTFDTNCLARTRDLHSDAVPTARSGTAYLFVRNVFGTYGLAATHIFSKDQPNKPAIPTITKILKGVQISMDTLPANCKNYKVIIDAGLSTETTYETNETPFTLFRTSGSLTVKYCFVDALSDGEYSDTTTVNIDTLIVASDINDGAVTAEKIAANAITADKINAGAVTTAKLDAEAVTAEKIKTGTITANNLSAGSVTADKVASGAITTEKLAAADITLSGLLKIVGGGVTLSYEGLKCILTNGNYVLFNNEGLSFYDSAGVAYSTIGRFVTGSAANGKHVSFNSPWDVTPTVICTPLNLQSNAAGYNSSDVEIVCSASDVTISGFTVNAYTKLKSGASGVSTLNYTILNKNGRGVYASVNATYTYNIPSSATHITAVINTNAHGAVESYSFSNAFGTTTTMAGGIKVFVKLEFYLNGVLKSTINHSSEYTTKNFNDNFEYDCPQNSTAYVVVTLWMDSDGESEVYDTLSTGGIITATSIAYNTTSDNIIATGNAYFIVTDIANHQYTIT